MDSSTCIPVVMPWKRGKDIQWDESFSKGHTDLHHSACGVWTHGALEKAQNLFEEVSKEMGKSTYCCVERFNRCLWTKWTLGQSIGGISPNGREMVKPNKITWVSLLSACAEAKELERGKQVHKELLESGAELTMELQNSLVNMYAQCDDLEEAALSLVE